MQRAIYLANNRESAKFGRKRDWRLTVPLKQSPRSKMRKFSPRRRLFSIGSIECPLLKRKAFLEIFFAWETPDNCTRMQPRRRTVSELDEDRYRALIGADLAGYLWIFPGRAWSRSCEVLAAHSPAIRLKRNILRRNFHLANETFSHNGLHKRLYFRRERPSVAFTTATGCER